MINFTSRTGLELCSFSVCVLQVYAQKYALASDMGSTLLSTSQAAIASLVDTTGAPLNAAQTIVVFNSLSWSRSDPVFLELPAGNFSIVDSHGVEVPSQMSVNGTILFAATDVPSFGYATFYAVPATFSPRIYIPSPGTPWTTPYTNAFYTVAPGRGGISSWIDLASGAELFDTRFYDVGEWMELQVRFMRCCFV